MKKDPGRLSNEQPRSDSAKCALPHETALLRENNQHEIGFPEVRPKPAIRILLMANHPIHRKGIRLILEDQDAMEIAGEISSVEELRRYQAPFDIVIFEPDSGNPDCAEMVAEVVLEAAQSRVIVLLDGYKPDLCLELARAGAMGVVYADQGIDFLLRAITKVHHGEVWLDHTTMAGIIREIAKPGQPQSKEEASKIASLTKREREVIRLLGEGLNPAVIAERLFISETTVRHHLTSILDKLGLHDRFDLVFYAYRHGLATPPKPHAVNPPNP